MLKQDDIQGITQQIELYSPSGDISCSAWSKDGKFVALGIVGARVLIWEEPALKASSAKFKSTLYLDTYIKRKRSLCVTQIDWSPKGSQLACMLSTGEVFTYELLTGESSLLSASTYGDKEPMEGLISWSSDGRHIAIVENGGIAIHKINGDVVKRLPMRGYSAVSWSPNGHMIAAGTSLGEIVLIDSHSGKEYSFRGGHAARITLLSWSSNGTTLASCSEDASVGVWDPTDADRNRMLEGHLHPAKQATFSADGLFVASTSQDSTRLWLRDTGEELVRIPKPVSKHIGGPLSFHPIKELLVTYALSKTTASVWSLHAPILFTASASKSLIKHISAKIVVVGESSVGKTCLAAKIATGSYSERGTTHGMQFWPLAPDRFDNNHVSPPEERRQIVLWDMGGQDQYRLIHQLFLHDTTVALVLFDPTRGRTAFEDVRVWNKRLEKQLRGRQVAKYLVGTKLESDEAVIDHRAIDDLVKSCGFTGYYPTSAKSGRGVTELTSAVASSLDWKRLAETTRPLLFQQIRDEIEQEWREGKVVLLYADLLRRVRARVEGDFSERAVDRVVRQLAQLGVLVESALSSGERALVLQISEVERYAGSIILLAHQHPQGIAAIEENQIGSPSLSFPGIREEDRLPRDQELVVLQCVVRLLLESGICLSHKGLLVFPSLFEISSSGSESDVQHSISLYYDFSGAIDNIYSSLVVLLAYSTDFGSMRLWSDRAEFEQPKKVVYGLKQVQRDGGFAHLDVYFSDEVTAEQRNLFNSFVEQHLRENGVDIREHIEVSCSYCLTVIGEQVIRSRIMGNKSDVGCPKCDNRIKISEGAAVARENDETLERRTWALKTKVENRKGGIAHSSERLFRGSIDSNRSQQPIRILHLSDLHMTDSSDPSTMALQLVKDLRGDVDGLSVDQIDYLVISGDITSKGAREGYSKASKLVESLLSEFDLLTPERCVIVPGNHDVDQEVQVYNWTEGRAKGDTDRLKEGTFVEQPYVLGKRNEARYPERFRLFSDLFYHPTSLMPYPSSLEEQAVSFLYPSDGIQFIALNSASLIDRFHPRRAAILDQAATAGIARADRQLEQARASRRIDPSRPVLRLAVWHHPVSGKESISDDGFASRLIQSGVRIGLHGHLHEDITSLFAYRCSGEMHVCGAGSFGAVSSDRPESTPRLYNLIEIDRKITKARVHTRGLDKPSACWGPYAKWPGSKSTERRAYYDVTFRSLGKSRKGFV